jgi:CheY-like chemotaxis protein
VQKQAVLIVDDDRDIRAALGELLAEDGYEVATATNGAEALELLRNSSPPCMVLLDLMMPVMDGYEFLEEQKRDPALAPVPVAIMTASDRVDRDRTNPAPVLRKPIKVGALASVMKHLCAQD